MKVLYIKESLLSSIFKDTYTFSCLGGLWYLNHAFCGGSVIIDLFVGLFVLIGAIGLGKKRYYPREALDVLREIAPLETMEKTGTSANSVSPKLALSLSRIVHDKCTNVPHDIGIDLAADVERQLRA